MENDVPVLTQESSALFAKNQEEARMKYGIETYWFLRIVDYAAMKRLNSSSQLQQEAHKTAGKYYKDNSFFDGAESYPPNSEEIKIAANIKEYYSVEIMKIIMAKPDQVQDMYRSMIVRMKQMGLDKLNAYNTNYFNKKQELLKKYGG